MLRFGVVLGAALCTVGLLIPSWGIVLWAGILVIAATPLAGVAATTAALVRERDVWAKAGAVLIAAIALGLVISLS
ncbi:MAG: hypothetical protein LBT41_02160 [Candidatus Methanoplasma sp.]|nr:hypothetical protein [Candidatus Methanoplasma sp.]